MSLVATCNDQTLMNVLKITKDSIKIANLTLSDTTIDRDSGETGLLVKFSVSSPADTHDDFQELYLGTTIEGGQTVDFTMYGDQSLVAGGSINQGDFVYFLDLSEVTAGAYFLDEFQFL